MQIMKQTAPLQRAVAMGQLTDKDNVQNWILNQPDILPRLNGRLIKQPSGYLSLFDVNRKMLLRRHIFDVDYNLACKSNTMKEFEEIRPEQRSQCMLEKMKYLSKSGELHKLIKIY